MVQHILFPTDNSIHAQKALEYVKAIAIPNQAKVTVLHTYEVSKLLSIHPNMNVNYHFLAEMNLDLKNKSHELLNTISQALQSEGVQVQILYKEGVAEKLICNVAEELSCDLIVMGRRGLGTIKEFLIGSVSQYVLHHSKVSVMLVPFLKEDKN